MAELIPDMICTLCNETWKDGLARVVGGRYNGRSRNFTSNMYEQTSKEWVSLPNCCLLRGGGTIRHGFHIGCLQNHLRETRDTWGAGHVMRCPVTNCNAIIPNEGEKQKAMSGNRDSEGNLVRKHRRFTINRATRSIEFKKFTLRVKQPTSCIGICSSEVHRTYSWSSSIHNKLEMEEFDKFRPVRSTRKDPPVEDYAGGEEPAAACDPNFSLLREASKQQKGRSSENSSRRRPASAARIRTRRKPVKPKPGNSSSRSGCQFPWSMALGAAALCVLVWVSIVGIPQILK